LQSRHQVRIASGQEIPNFDEIPELDAQLRSIEPFEETSAEGTEVTSTPSGVSDEARDEDVAKRAAALLQGMRGTDIPTEDLQGERRDSIRRSRRRDTAAEERMARRRRREQATSVIEPLGEGERTTEEVPDERADEQGQAEQPAESQANHDGEDNESKEAPDGAEAEEPPTPTTIISPPGPEGTKSKPIELDEQDEEGRSRRSNDGGKSRLLIGLD
jgi:cytokinesis protein